MGDRAHGRAVAAAAACLFGLAQFAAAQAPTGLNATRVASGLNQPLFVTAPPNDFNWLFIVQKTGQIQILNLQNGAVSSFLDISTRISTASEQGLLGLAFDPLYASNKKFYLYFVVPGGAFNMGTTHVSQFQVSATNPPVVDATSIATIGTANEKLLVSFDHPQQNHNGGWIGFSPRPNDDHDLYISTGDGGNGNDQGTGHIEPGGNAQNTTTLLGKMLRIHVDPTTGTASIPANNPFFGSGTSRQEIFSFGLRNPFRDSFDRLTGLMFIGDVGQDTREEVDVQNSAGGGENYGWRLREGFISTPTPTNSPVGGNRPSGNVDPIIDYPRATGGTVIGGYVYRGKQLPQLHGVFVFGDYLAAKVFTLDYNNGAAANFQTVTAQLFNSSNGLSLGAPSSFGEDANGELYLADINNGAVFRIIPTTPNVTIDNVNMPAGGLFTLQGTGVPFTTVTIQASSTTPAPAAFALLTTATVGGDGTFTYSDNSGITPRFYRVLYP